MTDALEQELRDALAERASAMPAANDALARLLEAGFQPRVPRRSSRLPTRQWSAVGGGAVWRRVGATSVALIAAIIAAVVILSSGGSALVPLAYAGWSAVPRAARPADIAGATTLCRAMFARTPTFPTEILNGAHLVLADERGKYVAVFWAKGRTTALCISDGRASHTTGGSSEGLVVTGGAQLSFPMSSTGSLRGFPGSKGVESQLFGRAAPDVKAITLIFPRGRSVQATVEHGWYFAWWPNSTLPLGIRAQTSTGTITIRG